jgi:hypothetical protein
MLTGKKIEILHGYTFYDHLITERDYEAVNEAICGKTFGSAKAAQNRAYLVYCKTCDKRVRSAKIKIELIAGNGELITVYS